MLLFFDTETTGLPLAYRAAVSDVRNWPRIVQIAWARYDATGSQIAAEEHLVRPEGFRIPAGATRVHGITTTAAAERGATLADVLCRFRTASAEANLLVSYNLAFDRGVVGAEMIRAGYRSAEMESALVAKPSVCLMAAATPWCRLPGRFGQWKLPKLAELHEKVFGERPARIHSALADVETCARCFFRLRELGVIR